MVLGSYSEWASHAHRPAEHPPRAGRPGQRVQLPWVRSATGICAAYHVRHWIDLGETRVANKTLCQMSELATPVVNRSLFTTGVARGPSVGRRRRRGLVY